MVTYSTILLYLILREGPGGGDNEIMRERVAERDKETERQRERERENKQTYLLCFLKKKEEGGGREDGH
jgi:hypothetical protein